MRKTASLSVNTISKALYSLDVHTRDLLVYKEFIKDSKQDKSKLYSDIKFCYNLKYLVMQQMIKQKLLIFQEMNEYTNSSGRYLLSTYRNKNGMPFIHPATKLDIYASIYSYEIYYPEYFANINHLAAFYSLKKSISILLKYIKKSKYYVRYTNIEILNESNLKQK